MHLKGIGLPCIQGKIRICSRPRVNGERATEGGGELARARSVGFTERRGYESNSSEVAAAVERSGAADSIMIIRRMKFTANHHAHTQ